MTNKLKLTTALAGSLMVLGASSSANAQTYYKDGISGNLAISYLATKSELRSNSSRYFGKESQFNLAASGSLNNGWTYKAGTSIEMDGGDGISAGNTSTAQAFAGATNPNGTNAASPTVNTLQGQQSENTFIDFINGNTTISIGADHYNMSDVNMTNLVGFGYIAADGIGGQTYGNTSVRAFYPTNISNYQAFGIGAIQNTSIGKFSINYTPHNNNAASSLDIFNATGGKTSGGALNSAYEVTYTGNLGLNGLTVLGSYMSWKGSVIAANSGGATLDSSSNRVAAKYNFGQFTVAADRSRETNVQSNTATGAGAQKLNGDSVGVAYAINKELSVGATYAEAKTDVALIGGLTTATGVAPKKENTYIFAVGYNLGPVAISTQYKNAQNVAGLSGNDGQQLGVWVNTSF
jgi:hypothetical protein